MSIKSHPDQAVQSVIDATKGQLIFDPLYLPPQSVMLSGYEGLRHALKWMMDRTGRDVPSDIQEVMRWLRDHFGPDASRKAALEKYRPDQGSLEARWVNGTFRDSPSSGRSST